jgi:sporulation protein YlmC with PRC-barrel domain
MKQKYIATLGALALTVPALAMAQTADQQRQDRSAQPGQQQQQTPGASQHTPGSTMQQERAQQQTREPGQSEYGQKQAGMAGHKQGAFKVGNLNGQEINNQQGESIGTIEDVLIDRDGRVAAVLVSAGGVMGIGGETKAVEWNRIEVELNTEQTDIERVTSTLTEQELENLPEFERKENR